MDLIETLPYLTSEDQTSHYHTWEHNTRHYHALPCKLTIYVIMAGNSINIIAIVQCFQFSFPSLSSSIPIPIYITIISDNNVLLSSNVVGYDPHLIWDKDFHCSESRVIKRYSIWTFFLLSFASLIILIPVFCPSQLSF